MKVVVQTLLQLTAPVVIEYDREQETFAINMNDGPTQLRCQDSALVMGSDLTEGEQRELALVAQEHLLSGALKEIRKQLKDFVKETTTPGTGTVQ